MEFASQADNLTRRNLRKYDPHYNHTGTVEDWEEMARWIREGTVVDANYIIKCHEKDLRRMLKDDIDRIRIAETHSRTVFQPSFSFTLIGIN